MSKTETSGIPTTGDGLTVTLPSDHAPVGTHAVVMHTAADGATSTPLAAPVTYCEPTAPAMPDLPAGRGVQVTSADQL
jgi:hypothetical protein